MSNPHSRRRARSSLFLTIVATLTIAACSESPGGPVAPEAAPAARSTAGSEEAALRELTRAVALSLQDEGLRHRVKSDLRSSRHTPEHKLHLQNYMKGESGGILLAKMAEETGKTREQVAALLHAVRPLEFYMPVSTHRGSWRGDANLLVASLLVDHATPIAYSLSGAPVELSPETPPSTPTLALVPVETDFSRPLDSRGRNTDDQGGTTIGTLCIDCEQATPGSGGGSTRPSGLYMTYSHLHNDGEAWLKGSPEIEVFVSGPPAPGQEGRELSCASDRASGYRYFDQNSSTWRGSVLLLSRDQITNYRMDTDNSFTVTIWEDDHDTCVIKTEMNLGDDLAAMAVASFGVYKAALCNTFYVDVWYRCVPTAVYGVYVFYKSFMDILRTNDDYLGVATLRNTVPNPGYSEATHILLRNPSGSDRNGAVSLELI